MNDPDLWRDTPATRGGCQCGAIHYDISAGPTKATLCHCRMCQRAMAAPFAAFLEIPQDRIIWHGAPVRFASSNRADRGFCGTCGTPLFFNFHDSDSIEITAATLPADFSYTPIRQHGVESRCPWLAGLNDLPQIETYSTGVISNQTFEK